MRNYGDLMASWGRQVVSVVTILFGSVLVTNSSAGPCGGTLLAKEPFPAIFVAVLGLTLIVCSYFPVRNLKAESSFRAIAYIFLAMWSLTLLVQIVDLARHGVPASEADIDDSIFSALRGAAAVACLFAFYRWVGLKNMITAHSGARRT
jgi:hypothetical protein